MDTDEIISKRLQCKNIQMDSTEHACKHTRMHTHRHTHTYVINYKMKKKENLNFAKFK